MNLIKSSGLGVTAYFCAVGFVCSICFCLLGCYSIPNASGQNNSNTVQNIKNSNTNKENSSSDDINSKDSKFEENRRLWKEKNTLNYDILISVSATSFTGPAEPVSIEVRDGKSVSIKRVETSDARSIEIYEAWDTIDKLFDLVKSQYEKDSSVITTYNKEFGYPEEVSFLPKRSNAVTSIKIIKFEIIK
jgi:Family of unknown function (DUF6174)